MGEIVRLCASRLGCEVTTIRCVPPLPPRAPHFSLGKQPHTYLAVGAAHCIYQITPICRVDVVSDVAGRHSCAYSRRSTDRGARGQEAGRERGRRVSERARYVSGDHIGSRSHDKSGTKRDRDKSK